MGRGRLPQTAEFPDLPAPIQAAAKAGPVIRFVKRAVIAFMAGVLVLFPHEEKVRQQTKGEPITRHFP